MDRSTRGATHGGLSFRFAVGTTRRACYDVNMVARCTGIRGILASAATWLGANLACAATSTIDDTPQDLFEDFVHYVLVADRDIAASLAEQLLHTEVSDAELARMVDATPAFVRRYERALSEAQKLPGVAALAHQLELRVQNGRDQLEQGERRLAAAIHTLIEEAHKAQQDHTLPRGSADLVRTIGGPVPVELIARQIITRQHHDDFIDAYVRWQLTSFNPALPAMEDARFRRLMDQLPRMVRNPRSDRDLIERFSAAQAAGGLAEADLRRANELLNELEERSTIALRLNTPALGLRDWLEVRLAGNSSRLSQARLERCHAMIEGGWPVESLKSRLQQFFQAAADDMDFEPPQRRAVSQQAERLAGRRVPLIASVRIIESSLSITYDEAAVYDFEVRKWIKTLMQDQSAQETHP